MRAGARSGFQGIYFPTGVCFSKGQLGLDKANEHLVQHGAGGVHSPAAVTASSLSCGKVLLAGEADPGLMGYF